MKKLILSSSISKRFCFHTKLHHCHIYLKELITINQPLSHVSKCSPLVFSKSVNVFWMVFVPNYVRLIWISTFYVLKHVAKMTHSWIVEQNQMYCRTKNCWTSHLLRLSIVIDYRGELTNQSENILWVLWKSYLNTICSSRQENICFF